MPIVTTHTIEEELEALGRPDLVSIVGEIKRQARQEALSHKATRHDLDQLRASSFVQKTVLDSAAIHLGATKSETVTDAVLRVVVERDDAVHKLGRALESEALLRSILLVSQEESLVEVATRRMCQLAGLARAARPAAPLPRWADTLLAGAALGKVLGTLAWSAVFPAKPAPKQDAPNYGDAP